MKKILVVDDESTLLATLKYTLERERFEVITAADGESALSLARLQHPALVLLDLMLPGVDGLQVCRILRHEMQVPILMLTAKAEEADKVLGLELGADDYMTKPFSMRELIARVHALLRRSESQAGGAGEVLRSGDLAVDTRKREVRRRDTAIALKPKEFELLAFFLLHRARAFTREQILNEIWGYDYAGDTRTVDVHVRWLREKIEDEPAKPTRLITIRGTGYRFDG